jgi:hypothetical protein
MWGSPSYGFKDLNEGQEIDFVTGKTIEELCQTEILTGVTEDTTTSSTEEK